MSLSEQIKVAQKAEEEVVPSPEVQAMIDRSELQGLLDDLPEGFRTERIITEGGAKVVIDISWGTETERRRIPISVRAERIAFMGDTQSQYFTEVRREELTPVKVRDQFLAAVANPQVIRR